MLDLIKVCKHKLSTKLQDENIMVCPIT